MSIYTGDAIEYWHKWQIEAYDALSADEAEKGAAYARLAEAAALMAQVLQPREEHHGL
jgi:hypothetical protein